MKVRLGWKGFFGGLLAVSVVLSGAQSRADADPCSNPRALLGRLLLDPSPAAPPTVERRDGDAAAVDRAARSIAARSAVLDKLLLDPDALAQDGAVPTVDVPQPSIPGFLVPIAEGLRERSVALSKLADDRTSSEGQSGLDHAAIRLGESAHLLLAQTGN